MPVNVELHDIRPIGPFDFRWPDATEHFDHGWDGTVDIDGRACRFRHGIGNRVAYGRSRAHSVTWLDGQPIVEGVETDDYERSHALVSEIKRPDRKLARALSEVPDGYRRFHIVTHRDAIDAPYSRNGLAVKLREDDLRSWARLAVLRAEVLGRAGGPSRRPGKPVRPAQPTGNLPAFEQVSRERKAAVARELIRFEEHRNGPVRRGIVKLTEDPEADQLVHEDGFAFLLGVLFDQQVQYGTAWGAPLELRRRLGHLDPRRMLREPEALAEAIRRRKALHRYVNKMPRWVLAACRRVVQEYGGRADAIWADRPTARALQERLDGFAGISQKKAAMTVMLLWRHRGVEVDEMEGCDVAVDIHLRRVFLRAGLVERDDPLDMVEAGRELWPALPGALDPQPGLLAGSTATPACRTARRARSRASARSSSSARRPSLSRRFMGPIERAVRNSIASGETLKTPARRASFVVGRIDRGGVVLHLGAGGWRARLSWDCLEGIVPYLSGQGWVRIDSKFHVGANPGTLDAYLKGCLKTATAGSVAAVLERAGVVEIDRSRPARVRLLPVSANTT